MRDPAGQFNTNIIKEVIKAFGVVPATFETLIVLGSIYTYTHFFIINSLDKDIVLKFGNNEITFPTSKDIWLDNFKFEGTIQYKYKSDAPTSGNLQIICY
jgi:hypothetical protein